MKKIFFKNFGCKVNQYDGQWMLEQLQSNDFEIVSDKQHADICIINTCTVTSRSDKKARNIITQCKKENPHARIIVAGCGATAQYEKLVRMPAVDCVLPNNDRDSILKAVKTNQYNSSRTDSSGEFTENEKSFGGNIQKQQIVSLIGHDRVFVKIQDGCDFFCSYCIIPHIRTTPVSKKPKDIITEVNNLVSNGCREIILTGINLGLYGKDLGKETTLDKMLDSLAQIPLLRRIRLSSIELNLITENLIKKILEYDTICNHLHIPLQSGSTDILKKMKRRYTSQDYIRKIEKIRTSIPDITFTTDILSGFPGETENDHLLSLSMIRKIGFTKVHVFPFSLRDGTDAVRYSAELLPSQLLKRRVAELEDCALRISDEVKKQKIGEIEEVFIESKRDKETGMLQGLTKNYIRVYATGNDLYQRQFVKIKITEIVNTMMMGEILS